ncbi:alpha/beta hydrolase [Kaistia algarum]|uniref:alpha/beta fold hydrolase n=1 Tax=Kaistia algarum TaxID=2083279 RepID=UPI000CE89D62|nr:alpha/beta hydrolase [Kaistia algarum]MCX5515416.1 alpha/beta hydrolase [Kaistia algarum]PPE78522.1 alpha/beta hydrolase [Kaistia algarum]
MDFLRRDGVALGYRLARGDGVPIVLVHGWCCDHSYFSPQFDHFAARGHTVFAPDLRGHGASDKPVQDYPISAFTDDVVWMLGELGVEKPVVVGHSMGGIIAFDLGVRYPDIPAAVVELDSSTVLTDTARAGMNAFIEALKRPDYQNAVETYVSKVLLIDSDDPARRQSILAGMASAPQQMMISAFTGLRDFDPTEGGKTMSLPNLYIAADEPSPRSDMTRLSQLVPHLLQGKVVGSGHFCQLEVPDQVNAMIDRFLNVTGIGAAG